MQESVVSYSPKETPPDFPGVVHIARVAPISRILSSRISPRRQLFICLGSYLPDQAALLGMHSCMTGTALHPDTYLAVSSKPWVLMSSIAICDGGHLTV